ncbi:acetyl-CoA carboxylase, biotin carboxyl carrier protein [Clostridia bacterium]|nr:acetyl-CoA carboxylase, biotin carboxyl carrier protein [Clostridia bacterium]
MNIDAVRSLTEIFTKNGLTRLEISEGDVKIRLEKEKTIVQAQPVAPAFAPIAPTGATLAPAAPAEGDKATENNSMDFSNLTDLKSPLVGVFYSAASPGAEPFVHIGSKVKKGDVLGIVEAMKLMNDIVAEQDGEIVDICIKDGDIAEFGQVLFKLF